MKGSDTMKQCFPLGEPLKFALVQLITHAHMPPDFLI
jgi:hypothetical protein